MINNIQYTYEKFKREGKRENYSIFLSNIKTNQGG